MSIQLIAETVNVNKETARKIIYNELYMKKVSVKFLILDQKPIHPSADLLRFS